MVTRHFSTHNRQPGQRHYRVEAQRNLTDLITELKAHPTMQDRWGKTTADAEPFIDWIYDIPQRMNNQLMIHHTARGIGGSVSVQGGSFLYEDATSPDWVDQAGVFLYWTYLQFLSLTTDQLAPSLRDELERDHRPYFLAFRKLTPAEQAWAENNRNKLCPCGSGWKCKRCHAR